MQLQMQNAEELNLEQISEFLKASYGIVFSGQGRAETYAWTQQVLIAQEYASLGKTERGAVRAYITKVTGLSLPQAARLIRMYGETGRIEQQRYQRRQFPRKYTAGDVTLLALARLSQIRGHNLRRGAVNIGRNQSACLDETYATSSPQHRLPYEGMITVLWIH